MWEEACSCLLGGVESASGLVKDRVVLLAFHDCVVVYEHVLWGDRAVVLFGPELQAGFEKLIEP